MNSLLDSIKATLVSASVANIYMDTQPLDADNCVTLVLVDGVSPTVYFGQASGFRYPFVQVTVRNKSSQQATQICEVIKSTLHTFSSGSIAGILQTGDVMTLGRDPLGRMEMMVNFRLILKE